MKATDVPAGIAVELKAQMQEACDRIAQGILPTMDERKQAAAKIDRLREENARRLGLQNVVVEAVRESRNHP